MATNCQSNSYTQETFNKFVHLSLNSQFDKEQSNTDLDRHTDETMCRSRSQLSIHQSSEGVNEETSRIGRLLLDSISAPLSEHASNL